MGFSIILVRPSTEALRKGLDALRIFFFKQCFAVNVFSRKGSLFRLYF